MNIKKFNFKRMATGAMAALLTMSMGLASAAQVSAAEVADATIHADQPCSLTLYKFDFTNAKKDGVWNSGSYTSTGVYDANVNDILGNAVRKGAEGSSSALGNGDSSNGYAIKGVEYSYLKVAEPYQFSESEADGKDASRLEVLYAFDKENTADLLTAIGLPDGAESDAKANALPGNEDSWYYRSDVINQALTSALNTNATTVKNALEAYISGKGTPMPLTDANGYSKASDLEVGLYLLVETKVPEMVTNTTNPFFISLPMTSVNGGGNGQGSNTTEVTDGGHRWIYDVTVYPKNETGIVSLEKTVRESKQDGGKNGGTDVITDGFAHSATASTGDILEYQIISSLPTITSKATSVSTYNFYDTISKGLTYNKEAQDVKLEWFTDKSCTDKVATWTQADGKFTVDYTEDGRHMTIDIAEEGLNEINAVTENVNGHLYVGYSNYTLRITYTAILNADATTTIGDSGNDNQVVLTWKRSSTDYYDTLIDDCHVFTYGINLAKQFSDTEDAQAQEQGMFEHVKFKLYNDIDKAWITASLNKEEGIYYVTGYASEESQATVFVPVTYKEMPGQIVIKGLEDDQYTLTEIETADHYTLLKDNIRLTITAEDDPAHPCQIYAEDVLGVLQNDPRYAFSGEEDLHLANIAQKAMAHNMLTAKATVDGNKTTMAEDNSSANALATLTVINTRGFDLPQTGDNGARQLPIAGAIIAGAAMVLGGCLTVFYFIKKKEQNA